MKSALNNLLKDAQRIFLSNPDAGLLAALRDAARSSEESSEREAIKAVAAAVRESDGDMWRQKAIARAITVTST